MHVHVDVLRCCFRDVVTAKLKDTSDGTYLVRNSQDGQGYTLTVRCVLNVEL